jgi:hypothetical protein
MHTEIKLKFDEWKGEGIIAVKELKVDPAYSKWDVPGCYRVLTAKDVNSLTLKVGLSDLSIAARVFNQPFARYFVQLVSCKGRSLKFIEMLERAGQVEFNPHDLMW